MIPDITRLETTTAFINCSTEFILTEALKGVQEKDYVTILVSGGSTPKKIYRLLSSSPYKEKFPWDKAYFFLSDERIVSCTEEESNCNMLEKNLFRGGLVEKKNIILPEIDVKDPIISAENYERKIMEFFKNKEPVIDLTLLGVGIDGHTASLFPGDYDVWKNSPKNVLSTSRPYGEPLTHRISAGLKLLNSSKTILLLAYGKEKSKIINQILEDINNKTNHINSPMVMIKPLLVYKWYIS